MVEILNYQSAECIKIILPKNKNQSIIVPNTHDDSSLKLNIQKGILYFLHNSKIPTLILFFMFFIVIWKPFFLFMCYSKAPETTDENTVTSKIEYYNEKILRKLISVVFGYKSMTAVKKEVLALSYILVATPVVALGFMFFSIGVSLYPLVMMSSEVFENIFIGLVYTIAGIVAHGIFEVSALICSGAMPLALFEIICSNYNDKISEEANNKCEMLFAEAKSIVFSKASMYCLIGIYTALFIGGQIESQFSGQFADYLFSSYFPF